ncbi:disulfide bond formation protein B [Paenibacillus albiflavus]|uniref:Disulfide bond formation protein B n=2 Tax=Paenibacillus albiflavus TaxID=2545760 RepID=A0A4R4E4C4_9BACL|nr:disulfide bond formation protein B [Paenibacillus albiflavus]
MFEVNRGFRSFILSNGMLMSWIVALVAMLGSLYFSEVLLYEPCKLCWYQRILMYPLVLILTVSILRKDNTQYHYILPFSLIGFCVSSYHYLLQKTDLFKSFSSSCGIVACDSDYINWLGFITIPLLAWTAFLLITIIQIMVWRADRK